MNLEIILGTDLSHVDIKPVSNPLRAQGRLHGQIMFVGVVCISAHLLYQINFGVDLVMLTMQLLILLHKVKMSLDPMYSASCINIDLICFQNSQFELTEFSCEYHEVFLLVAENS